VLNYTETWNILLQCSPVCISVQSFIVVFLLFSFTSWCTIFSHYLMSSYVLNERQLHFAYNTFTLLYEFWVDVLDQGSVRSFLILFYFYVSSFVDMPRLRPVSKWSSHSCGFVYVFDVLVSHLWHSCVLSVYVWPHVLISTEIQRHFYYLIVNHHWYSCSVNGTFAVAAVVVRKRLVTT
jgi:hypothetical protein